MTTVTVTPAGTVAVTLGPPTPSQIVTVGLQGPPGASGALNSPLLGPGDSLRNVIQPLSDVVALTLKEHAPQTANLLEIRNSAGTLTGFFGPGGLRGALGPFGIGPTLNLAAIPTQNTLTLDDRGRAVGAAASAFTSIFAPGVQSGGGRIDGVASILAPADVTSGPTSLAAFSATMPGLTYGSARTVSFWRGLAVMPGLSANLTVTSLQGLYTAPTIPVGGTVGTYYGLYVDNATGGGTLTNTTSIFLANALTGTTGIAYSIYSNGGTAVFKTGGPTTVGLQILADPAQSVNLQEWRDGSNALLGRVSATGGLFAPTATVTGLLTATGGVTAAADLSTSTNVTLTSVTSQVRLVSGNRGVPVLGGSGAGHKLILDQRAVPSVSVNDAIGLDVGALWFSVGVTGDVYRFYHGVTQSVGIASTGLTTPGFTLTGNGAGAARVLTSDASGNATWTALPATDYSSLPLLAPGTGARNVIQSSGNWVELTIRGAAAQAANLQEWQTSVPATVASMSPAGVLTAAGLIAGTIQITGGTPASGKVLTSDALGNGTWQVATGAPGGTDVSSAVLLAPPSSARNLIQPTGNFTNMILKAAGSQTANLLEFQTSGAVLVASVSPTGVLGIRAQAQFGNAITLGTPDPISVVELLDRSRTFASGAISRGLHLLYSPTPNGGAGTHRGIHVELGLQSGSTNELLTGLFVEYDTTVTYGVAQTTGLWQGIRHRPTVPANLTIGAMRGFADGVAVPANAAVTARYGLYLDTPTGAGTITDNYGVFVNDQTAFASTNPPWAIQTLGGRTEFSTGTAAIRGPVIRGAASQTANLMEWRTSADALLGSVSAAGLLTVPTFRVSTGGAAGLALLSDATGIATWQPVDHSSAVILAPTIGTRNLIQPTANVVPLSVRGFGVATANLQEWQTPTPTTVASISSTGVLTSSGLTASGTSALALVTATNLAVTGPTLLIPISNGAIPVVARGVASQTANLQEWQTSTPTTVASVTPAGVFTGLGLAITGVSTLTGSAPGSIVAAVRGAASQSANLQEWQTSAPATVASISAAGTLTAAGLTTGGNASVTGTLGVTGTTTLGVLGAGATTLTSLVVSGSVRFSTGGTAGYLLTSDATGVASWQAPSANLTGALLNAPTTGVRNEVMPTVDVVPLATRAMGTQSANLFEARSNASTPIAWITAGGDHAGSGGLSIGRSVQTPFVQGGVAQIWDQGRSIGALSSGLAISYQPLLTGASLDVRGVHLQVGISTTTTQAIGAISGVYNGMTVTTAASTTLAAHYGLYNQPTIGAGITAGIVLGLYDNPQITSTAGAVTTLQGVLVGGAVGSGASVTTRAGLQVNDITGAGTVGTNYGIYIANLAKGSTNYALYVAGGATSLGGTLAVIGASTLGALAVSTLRIGTSATAGYILVTDGLGNASWAVQPTSAGAVTLTPGTSSRNAIAPTADVVPLAVQAFASQTTNLLEVRSSGGTAIASFSSVGALAVPAFRMGTTTTAGFVLTADASGNGTWTATSHTPAVILSPGSSARNEVLGTADVVPLAVRAFSTQTSNLFEVRNTSGSSIASISGAGLLTVPNFTLTGNGAASGKVLTSDASGNASWTTISTSGVTLTPGNSTINTIQPTGDFIPLIIRGSVSQTNHLQQWQSNTPTVLAAMSSTGELLMSNSQVTFSSGMGLSAPTFNTRSVGSRVVLYPGASSSSAEYALGMSGATFWQSVDTTASAFRWYHGTTNTATLTSTVLSAPSALFAPSTDIVPLIVRGMSSQTNNLQQWQSNTPTTLMAVSNVGELLINVKPIIFDSNYGLAQPTLVTRSAGTRIVLFPFVGATTTDAALGSASLETWLSTTRTTSVFKVYHGGQLGTTMASDGLTSTSVYAKPLAGQDFISLLAYQQTGAASDIQQWRLTDETIIGYMNKSGHLLTTGGIETKPAATTGVGLQVGQFSSSQTADLLRFSDSSNATRLSGFDKAGRYVSGGTIPSLTAGAAAGTGPTITLTGTDVAGRLDVLVGSSPTASSIVVTVTFGTAYGAAPRAVNLTPANLPAAQIVSANALYVDYGTLSTTSFQLVCTGVLSASQTYRWFYQIVA